VNASSGVVAGTSSGLFALWLPGVAHGLQATVTAADTSNGQPAWNTTWPLQECASATAVALLAAPTAGCGTTLFAVIAGSDGGGKCACTYVAALEASDGEVMWTWQVRGVERG
jgi:outer membrane protein assembly factor BamB